MKGTPNSWKMGMLEKEIEKKKGKRTLEGLPVIDAKNVLLLEIKRPDILGSSKADAANCAAARALKRCYGSDARVFLTRTYVKIGNAWARFMTPEAISREITAFDRGATFEPGEYTLNPPPKTMRLDYRAKPTGPKKTSGKSSKPRHVTASVRKMK